MAIQKVSQILYVYQTWYVRTLDGDTIEIDIDYGWKLRQKQIMRFSDFDAYETRGAQAHEIGHKGKEALTSLFLKYGSPFYLHSDKDTVAVYNRVGGWLYLECTPNEWLDVIETMRASGFDKSGSVPYTGDIKEIKFQGDNFPEAMRDYYEANGWL